MNSGYNWTTPHPSPWPASSQSTEAANLQGLLPALIQCFSVILCGYLAGRFTCMTMTQAQGIGVYITKFALPALFFRVMTSIDFGNVSWAFILSVSLSKLAIFVMTVPLALILSRPTNWGLAGILSMFTTQSNDVALGYPILAPLYPAHVKYIYLFAPAQLVILNTMSTVLLEWHQVKQSERVQCPNDDTDKAVEMPVAPMRLGRRLWLVLRNVFLNPLVFMTIIGIIFNFILNHKIPLVIDKILEVLAQSFSATALFYLGINMVGKMGKIDKRGIYILVLILLAKLVIMPFVTRELVVRLSPGWAPNDTLDYSNVGFLYGALPTAPPVFLFAEQYKVVPDVIATGLVLGTFLCGPLMYISARLVTLSVATRDQYDDLLGSTAFHVAIVSVACCIWVIGVFLLSRRTSQLPHKFTLCLTSYVFLSCLGLVLGRLLRASWLTNQINLDQKGPASWTHYVQFVIFFVGCTGARFWTSLIALSLALLRVRSLCFLLRYQHLIVAAGFCTPLIITGGLLVGSAPQRIKDIDPAFQYGKSQLTVSLTVLLINIVATISLLIVLARYVPSDQVCSSMRPGADRDQMRLQPTQDEATNPSSSILAEEAEEEDYSEEELSDWIERRSCAPSCDGWKDGKSPCSPERKRRCNGLLAKYRKTVRYYRRVKIERDDKLHSRANLTSVSVEDLDSFTSESSSSTVVSGDEEFQIHRHVVLIICLLVTMFFGVCLCTWRLIREDASGVYIELEFLDSVFNFGQGIVIFAIFGLDTGSVILPCKRRLSKLIFGADKEIILPPLNDLDPEIVRTTDQFLAYHLEKCQKDIVRSRRSRLIFYTNVFTGSELVNWLIKAGLAPDRMEALAYGQRLLYGRLIVHVARRRYLRDDGSCLYRFIVQSGNTNKGLVDVEDLAGKLQ